MKLNGKSLCFSDSVQYLGITLDPYLNWKANTNLLCCKLRNANGIISRLRYLVPRKTLIAIYYALFFSHLNYACQVWGQNPNPTFNKIVTLQNRCLRLITFSGLAPSHQLFLELKLLRITDIIKLNNVLLIYNILNGKSPPRVTELFHLTPYPEHHSTRGSSKNMLVKPICRTTIYGINSIIYQSIVHWNEMQKHCPLPECLTISNLKTTYTNFLFGR